ncbi:VanZ family protein [Cytobacillus massiliigabonensis]|uniref:VanZ family protein n=1 Tax=Cytobacillus massiliigabonensis TaxID=1871011 RepID=UPI000C852F0F|nr:VanZ family protein [Cytobacillus massiliigabonensis]
MKKQHLITTITIIYTALTLYFMFLGFNRLEHRSNYMDAGYEFLIIPSSVPLKFPSFRFSWLYDLGNIAAFIPFGILFPLLKQVNFGKFLSWFIIVILGLEILQVLTYLGAFDADDIISNTIGAIIGYVVYKVGFTPKLTCMKLIVSCSTATLLLVCVMCVSEILDKRVSSKQPLQYIEETMGKKPLTKDIPNFTITGDTIEPQFNLYSNDRNTSQIYTYNVEGKEELIFYLNLGIPDSEEFKGKVTIYTDDRVRIQIDEKYLIEQGTMEMPLEIPLFNETKEITIAITGNIKLWDVDFTELKHWWE